MEDIEVEKRSTELNPALARITTGNEKVIIAECIVDIDGYEAPIYFCYPQGMFLPIKDVIYTEFSGEVDEIWKERLNELLLQTEVEVALELTKKEYFMREIIEWDVGTELILDVSKEDFVNLRIGDKDKFVCKLGKVKNRYAALLKEEVVKEEDEPGE